jgi:hypothetical protein
MKNMLLIGDVIWFGWGASTNTTLCDIFVLLLYLTFDCAGFFCIF